MQLNSRRERNRIAQNTFRLRQKATEKERQKEVEQLERMIDYVVSTFSSFAENVVESSWARRDTELIDKLRQSMQNIRTILSYGDGVPPPDVPQRDASGDLTSAPQKEMPSGESNDETMQHNPIGLEADASTEWRGRKYTEAPKVAEGGPHVNHTHFIANHHLNHPHEQDTHSDIEANIFGNGWMMLLPPMANISSHEFSQRKALDSPFSLQVALTALRAGYDTLLETKDTTQAAIQQTFGHVLQFRTREEILFNLRWYLGPGIGEIDQVALVSFNNRSASQFEKHILRNYIPDKQNEGESGGTGNPNGDEEQPVCNANDVAKWIRQRTVMEVDDDTLELNLNPSSAKSKAIKEAATYMSHGLLRLPDSSSDESGDEDAWMKQPVFILRRILWESMYRANRDKSNSGPTVAHWRLQNYEKEKKFKQL
ncbi:hypothetical protein CCHR01_00942 [Colletotrichum chrysophilum]|uniref:BZIP domain-containing protein n=1 Tax=Colletotrichum chrysophilum TaxID=1836956 RepID=A0AAD9AXL9_9PEZI|nr:hypothetical protein CCHR01_00942 [Colletotrichum chrysophilum]